MKPKKTIQLTEHQLTSFISEIVLEVSSQRQLDEQFDFSWEGIKNVVPYWADKLGYDLDDIDVSIEGISNAILVFLNESIPLN